MTKYIFQSTLLAYFRSAFLSCVVFLSSAHAARLVGERVRDGVVSGLAGEVGVVESGGALAGERLRDPGVLVVKVPDGDADALFDLHAGLDGVVVVLGLEGVGGGVNDVRVEADIQLGKRDLDACGDVGVHDGLLVCQRRGAAADYVVCL